MAVTGKNMVDQALRLIGHVNAQGAINENRESKYYAVALSYLTVLQYELLNRENSSAVPVPVSDLNDNLLVSDETAYKVIPSGLAMYFSLIDRDTDNYNHFSTVYYNNLLPLIKPDNVVIEDYYGISSDSSFQ
ncbi:MAG TPA: hypothetical protein VHR42_06220 [Clostridia bacterium]|nr:hypothetical protein [Clostridia bacterium]